jgi:hypothetical protein
VKTSSGEDAHRRHQYGPANAQRLKAVIKNEEVTGTLQKKQLYLAPDTSTIAPMI